MNILFLLVYVDDLVLTGNNGNLMDQLVTTLNNMFALKDLGSLSYFLGI